MDKKHWHASSGTMHPSVERRWGLASTHCRALLINDYVLHKEKVRCNNLPTHAYKVERGSCCFK